MSKGESKIIKKRLTNAYISTIISISLVLFLIGIAGLLLVNAKNVSDYFKENMKVSLLMKQETTEKQAIDFKNKLEDKRYVGKVKFISSEQGKREMSQLLGKDFLNVFVATPIPLSIEFTLKAEYVSTDSLFAVKSDIETNPLVDEIVYQQSLVEALNSNLEKISIVLAILIALLLFISFVLINNTIRLNIFSKRFTIHTMKLVGATKSFIRAPFLVQSVYQGLFSSFFAIIMLLSIMFFVKTEFTQLFEFFKQDLLLKVIAIVVVSGVTICLLSTYFVVNKLLSFSKDELYY